MSLPSILASAAAPAIINGLFGGSAPKNPYSPEITGALGAASGNAGALSGAGQQQLGAFNSFAPTATGQVNSYLNLLNQNPYTDSFSASQLANASNGLQGNYQAAGSNLTQQLANRGIGGGGLGGASSALAGGLAGIDLSKAGTLSQLQNSNAMNAIQQRYANLGQAANVAQGYAGQLFGQGTGALNQGAGIDLGVAQGYQGLSNQQQQSNEGYAQQLGGLGGALGNLAGSMYGAPSTGSNGSNSIPSQFQSLLGPLPGNSSNPFYTTQPNGALLTQYGAQGAPGGYVGNNYVGITQ